MAWGDPMQTQTIAVSTNGHVPDSACPNCGYCPHCRRSANPYPVVPWVYPTPYIRPYVTWVSDNSANDGSTFMDANGNWITYT